MDWQQWVSLGIVAVAAILLLGGRLRRRRFRFERDLPCGGVSSSTRPPTLVFRARKGARPEIVVKAESPVRTSLAPE